MFKVLMRAVNMAIGRVYANSVLLSKKGIM